MTQMIMPNGEIVQGNDGKNKRPKTAFGRK